MSPPPTISSLDALAETLRSGGLALLPTETVYGVFAAASQPAALDRLAALHERPPARRTLTWHAPGADAVRRVIPVVAPLHRRALQKLAPGPVRFVIELAPGALTQSLAALGVAPGVIDDGGAIAVRVPDHLATQRVLELSQVPAVAEAAASVGLGDGRSLPRDVGQLAAARHIDSWLDDGPTRLGLPSSTIRLRLGGTIDVEREGAFDERYIRRKLERLVLFVCSGNTCRSPVAEALARDALHTAPGQVPTRVASAGVAADDGSPMTREAQAALERLGVNPGRHRSRGVTRDELQRADAIFTMTRSHLGALDAIDPVAARRAHLLDPDGRDIPDPIGGPPSVYREMAANLRRMVQRRLADLDREQPPE